MCKVLKISRTVYYYQRKNKKDDVQLEKLIVTIFEESRNNYGTRKIQAILKWYNITVSRRRIARIMATKGLVSNYTVKQYKVTKTSCNEENVNNTWHYICILIDLYAREIIGYATGKWKDAALVHTALTRVNVGLNIN